MSLEQQIRMCIEDRLKRDRKAFIIFPFGDVGVKVKNCLNTCYGIEEAFIIDNNLCKYNSRIKDITILDILNSEEYVVLLASTNIEIYDDLKNAVLEYFPKECVAELSTMVNRKEHVQKKKYTTEVGKYSYGQLCCDHICIKSIGAFCSIAKGVRVVPNHPMEYITTHPLLYAGRNYEAVEEDYADFKERRFYFPNVQPRDVKEKNKRITIGNDVWLGENVIITNGANIGNGVVAGAGAVITKDVPDYAVVAGVPARVIRYRYTSEQIEKLNKIAWWDWPDEKIRECHDDFYLDIDSFLEKHYQ